MNRFLSVGAFLAASLVGGVAVAADMPMKAPPAPFVARWTGTYIGINGGYGWATSNESTVFATSGDYSQTGGLAGVTYGGNWQSGQWVLGFESDLDWANINGSVNNALCGAGCFTDLRALSTTRMRAGVDLNGWLLFGTAGAAWGDIKSGQVGCAPVLTAPSCGTGINPGWVAGLGVETMFAPRWSAKLEYLHFDLGNPILFTSLAPIKVLERGDLVRVGVNYHFDWFSLFH
jgi:outer membrane immunogenic protein